MNEQLEASPVSLEQANELQDILHTLTNSGTALITSARELAKSWETIRRERDTDRSRLVEAETSCLQQSKIALEMTEKAYSMRVSITEARRTMDGLCKELYDAQQEAEKLKVENARLLAQIKELKPEI